MLQISRNIIIPGNEIQIQAVRSRGAGGQNVNKVATAIHLRFDIRNSSLPEYYKERLLALDDRRITREGVIVIKAQQYRSQEKNRTAALARLQALIKSVAVVCKQRVATQPTKSAQQRRLDSKIRRGKVKSLRGTVSSNDY